MTKYKVIYEPKGKAAEYGELAVNLYSGCSHGCVYCYAPNVVKKSREEFFGNPQPRKNIIELLEDDVRKMVKEGDNREVFLCFTCDPYQPLEKIECCTYNALVMLLHKHIPVRILTKSSLAERDFAVMWARQEIVNFGMTLVFANDDDSRRYEPHADVTSERIKTLILAKRAWDLKTWVSLEPVWTPEDAFALIERTHSFVDEYRIGKLNYHPQAKNVDWKQFAIDVSQLCESLGCNYVLKENLKKLL